MPPYDDVLIAGRYVIGPSTPQLSQNTMQLRIGRKKRLQPLTQAQSS